MNLNHLYQNYGGYIIAFWALVLGAQNLIRMFVLSNSVIGLDAFEAIVWFRIYQVVSIAFTLAFILATIGLWRYRNWGRRLFLVTALLFFFVSLIGVFTLQRDMLTSGQVGILTFRYIISTLLPLAYLNLPNIRAKYQDI